MRKRTEEDEESCLEWGRRSTRKPSALLLGLASVLGGAKTELGHLLTPANLLGLIYLVFTELTLGN